MRRCERKLHRESGKPFIHIREMPTPAPTPKPDMSTDSRERRFVAGFSWSNEQSPSETGAP
jgi:hypothetical protein